MEETLRSPLADSAKAISDRSHVKPQPTELVTEDELGFWERSHCLYLSPDDVARLVATVRALQRDLAEARAKLVETQQVLDEQSGSGSVSNSDHVAMKSDFAIGTTLEVLTQDGPAPRQLVEKLGTTLYVCTDEEMEAAKLTNRKPMLCGFNRRFVLRDLGPQALKI